ncbi:MAG: hypothetical protein AAF675_20165, partial [Pseudomonadota bacterium]
MGARMGTGHGSDQGTSVLSWIDNRRLAFPFLALVATLLILTGRSAGLADPDYYWHLATGRLIAETGALPSTDPFSWTFGGEPWVLHEWVFQLGLFTVWRTTGAVGVLMAVVLATASAFYIVHAAADRLAGRPLVSLLVTLACSGGMAMVATPRPHLVSILAFALLLSVFFGSKYHARCRPLLLAAPVMLVWVNAHGGFMIGL